MSSKFFQGTVSKLCKPSLKYSYCEDKLLNFRGIDVDYDEAKEDRNAELMKIWTPLPPDNEDDDDVDEDAGAVDDDDEEVEDDATKIRSPD